MAVAVGAAVLAVAGASSPAAAQEQLRLRAGEHAEFSRVAIDVPNLGEWTVDRNGRLVTVLFQDREFLFDTTQIFPQRRVSRITSARSERGRDGTRLILSMSCACVAETYVFQDNMLVIDIRATPDEGEAAQTGDQQGGGAEGGGQGGGSANAGGAGGGLYGANGSGGSGEDGSGGGSGRGTRSGALSVSRPEPPPATSASVLAGPGAGADTASDTDASGTQDAEDAAAEGGESDAASETLSIAEAQKRLLEQLARAADQGLVEFRDPPEGGAVQMEGSGHARAGEHGGDAGSVARSAAPAPRPEASGATPPPASRREPREREPETPPDSIQLEARTVFDRDKITPRPKPPICAEDALLDPAAWRTEGDPMERMAAMRRKLMEEFDRPDGRAALDLARLQVGYGFGVEALQTLDQFAPQSPDAAALRDLARLADGDSLPLDGLLAARADCAGRAGMWRLAGRLPPAQGLLEDEAWRDSVLDAFAELPLMQRRRVGPALVETLVEFGHLDLAEAMRLRLDRAPGDHGDAWRLALGRLALARGEVEKGEALLRQAAEGGGPQAAEAMLALADSLLSRRDRLPEDLVESIGLAAFARQGTELGRRLLVAEILGRAGRHQLGEALQVIKTELFAGGARGEDLEAALRAILERAGAAETGAFDYAAAVMAHRDLLREPEEFDPARIRVARELTGIGLANAGLDILSPALTRGGEEARLTAAAADIALNRPDSALSRLIGLDGEDPDKLRARALLDMGREAEAYAAIAPHLPPDADEKARLAWRAAVWRDASELPERNPRQLLASWMAGERVAPSAAAAPEEGEESPPPDPAEAFLAMPEIGAPPSLAGARRAIERSQSVRKQLEEILNGGA